ncbi:hypothetical protein DL771_009985 [Monosporascus sp. 5C6A]|nr:hypothetical protein DL771_009985 [Monosporascus sp. 5C6A]
MDDRSSDFHLTIGTEDLVNGGAYFPPGASLSRAGWFQGEDDGTAGGYEYGQKRNVTEYYDDNSEVMRNITASFIYAGQWDRLDINQCREEYLDCHGLKKHRNVVLIADQPDGWARDYLWHLNHNEMALWDPLVPPDQPNHLFFSTLCSMKALYRNPERTAYCQNDCIAAMTGFFDYGWMQPDLNTSGLWSYSFFNGWEGWLRWRNIDGTPGLNPGSDRLSIKYCLAEPRESICHVGLSVTLLMAVTICVIGYFASLSSGSADDPSLPPTTVTEVGYSVWSLFILMVTCLILICIPVVLSLKRLPIDIVNVGSNSLAISAACHVSPLSYAVQKSPVLDIPSSSESDLFPARCVAMELRNWAGVDGYDDDRGGIHLHKTPDRVSSKHSLISKTAGEEDVYADEGVFVKLSRSKLRWGVVKMPPSWYEFDGEVQVEHLSFGVREDGVSSPVPGHWYA